MAETAKLTTSVLVETATPVQVATVPAGSYEYTFSVASNWRAFSLAANAIDTALDIADMAAVRFLCLTADQNLLIQVGATDAAEIYVPAGHQQQLIWRSDVTAIYMTNLNVSTAANVYVVFGK